MEQRAALRTVVGQEHRCRQMLWIRVDGVTEKNELEQRDPDRHAESQPVPAHLDEFLEYHGPKSGH